MQGSGSEQHRHHAVEVAVFNMFCMLWEVEMGTPYQMLKKNDIFSGLGKVDMEKTATSLPADKKQMDKEAAKSKMEEEGGNADLPVVEELFDIQEESAQEQEEEQPEEQPVEVGESRDRETANAVNSEEEDEFARELKRAECIVETFRDAKVS